jgi:hypothetical protein
MKISKPIQFASAATVAAICAFTVIPTVIQKFRNRNSNDEDLAAVGAKNGAKTSKDATNPKSIEPPQRFLSLVPEAKVVLTAHGWRDDERFARVFRETWDRIPEFETAVIVAFWEKRREEIAASLPHIELVEGSQMPDPEPIEGCTLQFKISEVEKMADDVLEVWIAFKLAQISLIAKEMQEDDEDDLMAKEILTHWKFDGSKLSI